MFEPTTTAPSVGEVTIVYGVSGCGKTTLITQAVKEAGERGLFIPVVEDGLSPLQKNNIVADLSGVNRLPAPITKWTSDKGGLVQLLRWICSPEQLNKYDVIAVDSLNLIVSDLEDYAFTTYFVNNPEYSGKDEKIVKALAYGFGKNGLVNHMANEWSTVVKALRFLKSHGKKVFISCHRGVRKVKIVDQDVEFDSYTIDLPAVKQADMAGMLIAEADTVVYGKFDVQTSRGKGGKVNVSGGTDRVLIATQTATVAAKNRSSIPDEVPFTWEELKKYL